MNFNVIKSTNLSVILVLFSLQLRLLKNNVLHHLNFTVSTNYSTLHYNLCLSSLGLFQYYPKHLQLRKLFSEPY